MDAIFAESENIKLVTWVIIPLLIFLARIIDVSLGTIRFIFISRGFKFMAPLIGFFEVLVWVVAIGQIMKNLSNPMCYIAYAAGFSTGTYVGIAIAQKLSLGVVMIRIITNREAPMLVDALRSANHRVTTIDGDGRDGPVKLIFTIVQRKNAMRVINTIKRFNPKAFYTIEEIGYVDKETFSSGNLLKDRSRFKFSRPFRIVK